MKTLVLEKQYPLIRDAALVLLASFVLALFAKVAIPLPFTPVPIATQSAVVLLLGALLGARRATAAVFAFLAQGAMGLPVFAAGIGLAYLFGPCGGYLFGYLAAAFVVGGLFERSKDLFSATLAMIAGTLVIYLFGAGYLATFIGLKKALLLGVAPFLLGDALKILVCLKIVQWFKKI